MKKNLICKYFLSAFIFITLLHLSSIMFNYEAGRFITKPLLMLLLTGAVFTYPSSTERNIFIAALLFSFAGDCFLLYDYLNPLFFIFGLICFLLTHILYIIFFLKVNSPQPSLIKLKPWLAVLIILYGITLVYLLYPNLGNLTIPVIVYAIIICGMMIAALHIYFKLPVKAVALFITGAALFIISDSLLAVNKFINSFTGASFLIMFTYCAAQFFIVKGFVQKNTEQKSPF